MFFSRLVAKTERENILQNDATEMGFFQLVEMSPAGLLLSACFSSCALTSKSVPNLLRYSVLSPRAIDIAL